MAWIKVIDEQEASGELAEIYADLIKSRGKLANIMKIQSLNPAAMKAHMDLYLALMFRASCLKRAEREMIAVTVSVANQCKYCINHHAEALNFYWKDQTKLQRFIADFEAMELPSHQQAMLRYARKLTLHPEAMEEEDIRQLKENGLNDRDILDINLIVSYFNFVNRIANGLGVEFSREEMSGYKY